MHIAGFTQEQMENLFAIAQASAVNRRPKVKPPPEYKGERSMLRTFIVQCNLYFEATGETDDRGRIAYTKSLLRDAAAKWITPYAEGTRREDWTTWTEFLEALRKQFADVDAENSARTKIESMVQGRKTITDHWNEFRLTATEANYDDKTMQRLLLKGLNTTLQEAWAQDNYDVDDVEDLAGWAIKKENRINFVRSIQNRSTTTRVLEAPRNNDGTFRPTVNNNTRGDPMDLDATRRRPNFDLSRNEFQRRMRGSLCLSCGKPGHRARDCRSPKDNKDYTTQQRGMSQGRQGRWQPRPAIKEIEIEQEAEQSGNEESPQ
jgi:hypothetical protein